MNDDDNENLSREQLYPAWKQAVKLFFETGFGFGDLLSHEWQYRAFNIEMPGKETPLEIAERAKLEKLRAFKEFENYLLTEKQVALRSVPGQGHEIVQPKEQTAWAEKEAAQELTRNMKKLGHRLVNVDLSELTHQERRENADALSRLSMLGNILRKKTDRLPTITKIETD